MLLYKYVPLTPDSLKIFSEGTIKYSKPSEVNDPFDCFPVHKGDDSQTFVKSRPDLIKKAAKMRGLSVSALLQEEPASRLQKIKESGQFSKEISDTVGICSLTRDPLNMLMWSHYAKNHTGFVVEFNIPEESYNQYVTALQLAKYLIPIDEVEYKLKRPVIQYDDTPEDKITKQFLTKSLVWKYEQEERVIDFARGHGIHSYNQNVLKSVIAGANIGKNRNDLKDKVDNLNTNKNLTITFHEVKLNLKKYEIYVPTRPELKQTYFQ